MLKLTARRSALAVCVCVIAPALAGPVTLKDGNLAVTYSAINGTDTKSFTVTAPGSGTLSYMGTRFADDPLGIGDHRGDSGITYNIQPSSGGANFDVTIFHSNRGDDQRTLGGSVDFGIGFATDRPLHYTWQINPTGATSFVAALDQMSESLQIDALGTGSGSLFDIAPTPKTLQGILPAGSHSLALVMDIANGRSPGGVPDTRGSVALTLSPTGPAAIPLPAGVWSGGAMLLLCTAIAAARRAITVR